MRLLRERDVRRREGRDQKFGLRVRDIKGGLRVEERLQGLEVVGLERLVLKTVSELGPGLDYCSSGRR